MLLSPPAFGIILWQVFEVKKKKSHRKHFKKHGNLVNYIELKREKNLQKKIEKAKDIYYFCMILFYVEDIKII